MAKPIKKKPTKAKHRAMKRLRPMRREGSIATKVEGLKESKLKTFDIPIAQLVEHEDNANQQDEAVFDEIVDRIRNEGFDEPIIVFPEIVNGTPTGKYKIASGHHRTKAARLAGYEHVPAVIRQGWDEDRALVELVARNQLRGNTDPEQFTKNYNKLKERYGEDELRRMMGLSGKKAFESLYKGVKSQLTKKQQKKLEESKEEIKSVEDLSQILNQIFRENGSKLDKSMVVFSFGGKEHHYIQLDKPGNNALKSFIEEVENSDKQIGDVISTLFINADAKATIKKAP